MGLQLLLPTFERFLLLRSLGMCRVFFFCGHREATAFPIPAAAELPFLFPKTCFYLYSKSIFGCISTGQPVLSVPKTGEFMTWEKESKQLKSWRAPESSIVPLALRPQRGSPLTAGLGHVSAHRSPRLRAQTLVSAESSIRVLACSLTSRAPQASHLSYDSVFLNVQ